MPGSVVVLTAVACGVAAFALAPWLRAVAASDSAWLTSGLHVFGAAIGGAGAAALARSWAEVVAYAVVAVACAMVVVVDIAEHRIPKAVLRPAALAFLASLAVAAAVATEWARWGRAVVAGAVLFGVYYAMVRAAPGGIGRGDANLAGLLGVFLGWLGWVHVLAGTMAAFVLGGAFSLALVASRRADLGTALPFGPWMVLGAVVGAAWGPAVVGLA